jgi:prephenate dehydrogenase
VAVLDPDPLKLRFIYNTQRMTDATEVKDFAPELVINAATLKYTIPAFHNVLPISAETCILSDIASVKTD